VVRNFLRAGGRFGGDVVSYRGLELPREVFRGAELAGVGYLQQLVDHGATVAQEEGGRYVTRLPNGLRFEADRAGLIDSLCMLAERFVADEYGWLQPQGKVVIDVGANIGDSVLYFAKRGAVFVYGYEPNPLAFASATRNLALNSVTNASIVQAAVGASEAEGSVTLGSIVEQVKRRHAETPIVCKIDCEGCEFDVLVDGDSDSALTHLSQLMVEYHWRSPAPLVEALRQAGFVIETSSGAPGVGWIRASRRGAPDRAA
jgi:hypothetical protein